MKYLIFIFFSINAFSQSQNSTFRIEAFKLIDEFSDGPCFIKSYLEIEGVTSVYLQSLDLNVDVKFISELKRIVKKSEKWKSIEFNCSDNCRGCDTVDSMLIFNDSNQNDTLYFVDNFSKIYNPKKQKVYIDENQKLKKLFNKNEELTQFIEINFNVILDEIFRVKKDSISIHSIKINDKSINETIEFTENKTQILNINETSSSKSYYSLKINNQILKTETEILELFSDLKKETNYRKRLFKDKYGNYMITLKIADSLGWITFNMKEEIIQTVEISIN